MSVPCSRAQKVKVSSKAQQRKGGCAAVQHEPVTTEEKGLGTHTRSPLFTTLYLSLFCFFFTLSLPSRYTHTIDHVQRKSCHKTPPCAHKCTRYLCVIHSCGYTWPRLNAHLLRCFGVPLIHIYINVQCPSNVYTLRNAKIRYSINNDKESEDWGGCQTRQSPLLSLYSLASQISFLF